MKKLLVAIGATLIVVTPAFATTTVKKKHPHHAQKLYMQAPAQQAQPEPAMMNRGKPNTSPDPFINNYLKRSYMGTGQG